MKFRNKNIKNTLYDMYYDPHRLINRFSTLFRYFSEFYELNFEESVDNYVSHNVKDVYTDKRYIAIFTGRDENKINIRFIIPIPDLVSNGSLNVRFNAFFPKKLTDTLFSFSTPSSSDEIRVNIRLMYARTLDVFISEKSQEKIHLTDNVIVKDKVKTLCNMLYDEELYEQSRDIAEAFNLKPKKPDTVSFEKGHKLIKMLFNQNKIAQMYFRNEFEMLLYGYLLTLTTLPPYFYKYDNGISLVHKRLMNEEDMIFYSVSYSVIQFVLDKIKNKDYRTFPRLIDLSGLLSKLGLYEQFGSPTAFISNINRVDPLEPLGCIFKDKAEKVPLNLRDIHPSYYKIFDPYTQSDKEKTGVYNWLSCSSEIDEYGRFKSLINDEYVLFTNSIYSSLGNVDFKPIKDDVDFDNLPIFTKSLYDVLTERYEFNPNHPYYRFEKIDGYDDMNYDEDETIDNDDSIQPFEESLIQVSDSEIVEIEEVE